MFRCIKFVYLISLAREFQFRTSLQNSLNRGINVCIKTRQEFPFFFLLSILRYVFVFPGICCKFQEMSPMQLLEICLWLDSKNKNKTRHSQMYLLSDTLELSTALKYLRILITTNKVEVGPLKLHKEVHSLQNIMFKIIKFGYPFRPIISQVPTHKCQLPKSLNTKLPFKILVPLTSFTNSSLQQTS